MGLETKCTLCLGREEFAGTAHLDSTALAFRGGAKLSIALGTVKSADVAPGGDLRVTHVGGTFSLLLADRATAEKWALKIRHPKSLIDKLGLKPASRIAMLGVDDTDFRAQAAARLTAPPLTKLPARSAAVGAGPTATTLSTAGASATAAAATSLDFIFYAADSEAELAHLADLKRHLAPTGAIWVVSLKDKAARLKDTDVMHAAKTAGLAANKVCSFSATHTALKLVIPVAAR